VGTERVEISPALDEAVGRELDGRIAILIGDANTLRACGNALAEKLTSRGLRSWTVDLAPDGRVLHADDETLERVRRHLRELPADALPIAVGSGTINDLVKAASHEQARPYIIVATAASMNGYTSAIASITMDGLKRTLRATPPVAVLTDPAVLASSPPRMALSGLADLLSKPVSNADWKLEHLLWDEPYCPRPAALAGRGMERAVRLAGEIGSGQLEAHMALFEALLLSGISMAVAGVSSPASGGEHLVSHYLDMTAPYSPGGPRTPALHGEQVGLATRVTYTLYVELLSLDAGKIDWRLAGQAAARIEDAEARLASVESLPDRLRELFLQESARKLERIGPPAERIERIRSQWDALREQLVPMLEPAGRYIDVLSQTGAPSAPEELGIAGAEFEEACRLARWVRDRYTILDLVGDLGLAT
jgi:glycerol-1-phosphate dehydrogenase [NAD(P)+]